MKIIKSTTVELSEQEFSKLSDRISDALYDIEPEIKNLYDVHIDYILDNWHVEFVPTDVSIPVLKVSAYTAYTDNREFLYIKPESITKFLSQYNISDYSDAIDFANNLSILSDFILGLHDFSYQF